MKKRNRCLNFFKGVACFCVIGAHVNLQGLIGQSFLSLIGWTVPFFLMISGYYSYYEEEEKFFKKTKNKAKNILKVAIISLIIYFIVTFINEFLKNDLNQLIEQIFRIRTIFDVLILNDFTAINAGHLWFLISLVYCYIILIFAVKYKKIKLMYILSIILLIIRMILFPIVGGNWHYLQNVFMCALPCFFIGYYFADYSDKFQQLIEKWNNNQLKIFMISGLIFGLLGIFIKLPIHIFEMGSITTAVCIFIFAQKNPDNYLSKFFETVGIKYSGLIYISHVLFFLIVRWTFNKLSLNNIFGSLYIRAFLVVIITFLGSVILEKIISTIYSNKKIGGKQNGRN